MGQKRPRPPCAASWSGLRCGGAKPMQTSWRAVLLDFEGPGEAIGKCEQCPFVLRHIIGECCGEPFVLITKCLVKHLVALRIVCSHRRLSGMTVIITSYRTVKGRGLGVRRSCSKELCRMAATISLWSCYHSVCNMVNKLPTRYMRSFDARLQRARELELTLDLPSAKPWLVAWSLILVGRATVQV